MPRNNSDFQNGRWVSATGNAFKKIGIEHSPEGPNWQENKAVDFNINRGWISSIDLPSSTPLYTMQNSVDTAGVRHYYDHPDEKLPDPGHARPIVWQDSGGKHWIKEGNHRIVASRLRGDKSIAVDFSIHKHLPPMLWEK
jgi:hypothetical protein